jgi:hypothetical protein
VSTITLEELNTFARKIVKFHQQLTNPDINRSCQIFDAANPERKECQLFKDEYQTKGSWRYHEQTNKLFRTAENI